MKSWLICAGILLIAGVSTARAAQVAGGGEKAPVGTVYVGLADGGACSVTHRQFLGDRARIRQFSTQMALDILRRKCQIAIA